MLWICRTRQILLVSASSIGGGGVKTHLSKGVYATLQWCAVRAGFILATIFQSIWGDSFKLWVSSRKLADRDQLRTTTIQQSSHCINCRCRRNSTKKFSGGVIKMHPVFQLWSPRHRIQIHWHLGWCQDDFAQSETLFIPSRQIEVYWTWLSEHVGRCKYHLQVWHCRGSFCNEK